MHPIGIKFTHILFLACGQLNIRERHHKLKQMVVTEIRYFRVYFVVFYCSTFRLYIRAEIKLVGHSSFLTNKFCRDDYGKFRLCLKCMLIWGITVFWSGNMLKGLDHHAFSIMSLSLTGLPATQIKGAAKAISCLS